YVHKFISVKLETEYPEVVLDVGKICFGEKARKHIPKNSRQYQKDILACAVCALLNSGGGVVKAEIENKTYNLASETIGLDLEEIFQFLGLYPDLGKYLDFKQQDDCIFIFIKTWSSKNTTSTSRKPRFCSLSTGLYTKYGASLSRVAPDKALSFLESSHDNARRELTIEPYVKKMRTMSIEENYRNNTLRAVAELYNRDQLQRGEMLTFRESQYVEFKHYENILKCVKGILPKYIAGFANADGGYLWIGVDDDGTVKGFSSDDEGLQQLSDAIDSVQDKLILSHFCKNGLAHNIQHQHKIFKVCTEDGNHCGYVCAVKIQPFTCIVFSEDPDSWIVEDRTIRRLKADEWAEWMSAADPDLSKLSETFRLELSLSEGPPLVKPVYSHQGLNNVDDLCKQLFPVEPHGITYMPKKLCEDLLRKWPELNTVMENQLKHLSEGILIFSRSWAVEVGLPEKKDIVCDVLLIAKSWPPVLYTICEHHISQDLFKYSRQVAQQLKQKLVNTGGYIHKLCVIPKVLALLPKENCGKECGNLNIQELYPQDYGLIESNNLKDLLRALTIVLLSFKSFLSDYVGTEFLNLLTFKQYQLLSENLHRTKKLYIYGLPGTGKTIMALKIIERIRSMLQCRQEEVLYVCENKPLSTFVMKRNICEAVTRANFMMKSFKKVKHIIIDEAQNFRVENGDWYQKALALTSSADLPEPGFLWIFLDFLQTSHPYSSGLPEARLHDPIEFLTKVVRNANSIFDYIKERMETIVKETTLNIPRQRLEGLLERATCAHDVQGCIKLDTKQDIEEIAEYVAEHCREYLNRGYSEKDIAILCYTKNHVEEWQEIIAVALRNKRTRILLRNTEEGLEEHTILDSVRCFSGLERNIVFGIIPANFPDHRVILDNILVCVASRANLYLHLLF
ncbi:SLN13 protein, partial [Turnix velox]|nr:SLN13 protein [Turnix velox]